MAEETKVYYDKYKAKYGSSSVKKQLDDKIKSATENKKTEESLIDYSIRKGDYKLADSLLSKDIMPEAKYRKNKLEDINLNPDKSPEEIALEVLNKFKGDF